MATYLEEREKWKSRDLSELSVDPAMPPRERASRHEQRAKQHYLRGDYPSAVEELQKCIGTGALDDGKELKMRVFVLQSHRRLGNLDLAWQELKKLEEKYGNSSEKFVQNQILNEREFMEGKIVLESKPLRLTVRPTGRCSIHCIMCTFWHEEPWDMPEKTLQEVADLYPYLEDLLWQGGEVFEMKREVFENLILRGIDYPRMLQNIITNALLIDEKWADILVRANVHMKCSIDGATKEVYERIRVLAKFDDILRSVNNLNNAMERLNKHCWLSLHFVVQRYNYHQIEQIVEFAREYRFNAVALSPMEGDSYRHIDIFNYGNKGIWDEIQAQRARAAQKALEYGIYLEDNLPAPPSPAQEPLPKAPEPKPDGEQEKRFSLYPMPVEEGARYTSPSYGYFCASPWKNLILRNRGGILPNWHCGERYIGNIHENSILEIWNGEPMQRVRKAIIERRFGGVCRSYCLSGALTEPWKHHMEWYWS